MKKPHKHDEFSDVKCGNPKCDKFLKKNLVERKPTADRCYACNKRKEAHRGHMVDSKPRQKRIAAGLPVKNYG